MPPDPSSPPVPDEDLRARLQAAAGGRYEVLECLGAGGAGVVYRAIDREVDAEIAIKILRSLDAESLVRFKDEFRQIAGIVHPNLVKLYELTSEAGLWFLTMEYVPGADIKSAVRTPASAEPPRAGSEGAVTAPIQPASRAAVDERRLRDCFGQLVAGLSALHAAGTLHLDIKPSNVRVTPDGRLVILDFGLATPHNQVRTTREVVGTLGYMAPERFEAAGALPASDWYAAGCLLFECLVGYLPFAGPVDDVLADKRRHALPVATVPAGLEDLARLASELSASDPAARPHPPFSRRRPGSKSDAPLDLGPAGGAAPPPSALAAPGGDVTIGRERHLEALMHALSTISAGRGLAVHLHGRSGAGKSTLLRLFVESATAYGAVVLVGKCYERESVPYEALDSIVDALGRFLIDLPPAELRPLLPEGIEPLARVFPTLRRVPAIAAAVEDAPLSAEPNDLRRTAFTLFRELVTRIALRRPLVLAIDDLQWGDADSAPLLDLLLERPEQTPLLLIMAYRSEDRDRSPLLQALAERAAGLGGAEVKTVEVGTLDRAEATALAALLLRQGGGDPRLAPGIAEESQGLPYFIHELVRFSTRAGATHDATRRPSLDELIRARVETLEAPSRRLLELASVAGRPTPLPVLIGAAELPAADALAAFTGLAAAHLVRWVRAGANARQGQDVVEPYHDRIAAVVAGSLDDVLRGLHHGALAAQLERHCPDDIDALVVHCRGCGRLGAARGYAVRAADVAFDALAFDRAATLYQAALELAPEGAAQANLRVRLAEALDFAGRAAQAAHAYLNAMDSVDATSAAALQRQAALQFLKAGHVDDGLKTLDTVLTRAGLRLPRGPALLGLMWARLRLRLRGLGYRARSERELRPIDLERIDAARTAALGLGLIDTFRGALFQTASLRLALHAGEETRIARCFGLEAVYSSAGGDVTAARTHELVKRGKAISERLHDGVGMAWLGATEALLAFQSGRFSECNDVASEAIRLLRASPETSSWEVTNVELWRAWSLFYMGRHGELLRLVRERMRVAIDRGDHYEQVNLQTGLPANAWLVADAPDELRKNVKQAMTSWTLSGYHLQHYFQLVALVNADLYGGDGATGLDRVARAWPALRRSLLMQIVSVAIEGLHLRARAAVATAAAAPDPRAVRAALGAAEKDAAAIQRRSKNPWARAFAALLRAEIAALRGSRDAVAAFVEAEKRCQEADMLGYLQAARRRRGLLVGGDAGRELVAAAEAELATSGVANPARFAAMLVP